MGVGDSPSPQSHETGDPRSLHMQGGPGVAGAGAREALWVVVAAALACATCLPS